MSESRCFWEHPQKADTTEKLLISGILRAPKIAPPSHLNLPVLPGSAQFNPRAEIAKIIGPTELSSGVHNSAQNGPQNPYFEAFLTVSMGFPDFWPQTCSKKWSKSGLSRFYELALFSDGRSYFSRTKLFSAYNNFPRTVISRGPVYKRGAG